MNKRIDNSNDLKFNSVNLRDFRWRDQSLPRVVSPYTLSNLCQRLYAKHLGKIRLLKGNLI